ncbi:MAG: ORF6N domain-containing protein [Bacteroidota bacterium]
MGKILLFRGIKVMIDSDLAELYGVSTKRLNEEDKMTVRKRIGFKRSGEN